MSFRSATVALVSTLLALSVGATAPVGATVGAAPTRPAAAADDRSAVERALDRAEAALSGEGRPSRDVTMALRDLMKYRSQMTAEQRAQYRGINDRPDTSRRACTSRICVHWNPGQVSGNDSNDNGRSDYIDKVVNAVDDVHKKYKNAGYREPKSDHGRGGNNKTDIYIDNIGDQYYGYCTSDEMIPVGQRTTWAFCVLDNNYSQAEFPTNTPIENMKVTAAHEYYHAVQFAYDAFENAWFMEATATWAEDEVYDSVNDNRNYLPSSPLTAPWVPLDTFSGTFQYGTWIFFRYLTEKYEASSAGMPTLVRSMWRKAPSNNSLTSIKKVLADKGTSLKTQFTRFVDANLTPQESYDEGADGPGYPGPTLWREDTLTGASPSDSGSVELDHLTSASARYTPSGLTGPWDLQVHVKMAPTDRGSTAIVTVHYLTSAPGTTVVPLDDEGDAFLQVDFSSDVVDWIDVSMVNASTKGADDDRMATLNVEAFPVKG